jgi:hypothetical protein
MSGILEMGSTLREFDVGLKNKDAECPEKKIVIFRLISRHIRMNMGGLS